MAHGQNPQDAPLSDAQMPDQLTVDSLLSQPELRPTRVLFGAAGLARPVVWCLPWTEVTAHDGRVESVVVHAHTADLAVVADLAQCFGRLAERGASALLLSGDGRTLPIDSLTRAPDDFPVVQLPAKAGFAVANRVVAEQSLAQAAHVLQYGIQVHRSLASLLHRGSGLSALGRQLASLAKSPAFVLDPNGEVLSYEYLGAASVPDPFEVARLLRDVDIFGGSTLGAASPAHIHVVELALEDARVTCVVGPIVLNRRHYGTVVVAELASPPPAADLARHRVIVEQATTIIGSELLRQRSVDEAMERARGDFVHALLHGRFANPHDLTARAAHHDFDIEARYGVVAVHGCDAGADAPTTSTMSLVRRAEQVLPVTGVRTLATVVDDVLVAIREVLPASPARPDLGSVQLAEYANALAQDLESRLGRPVTVTYGRSARGARGIGESYREARTTLGVCDRLHLRRVCGYTDLRVYAALADVAASQQAKEFAREILAPLRHGAGSDLERTVMAYVETGGNLNAAARNLQLHRNTILYKLDRAERLLGVDLRQADNQFMVWLAHRIDLLSAVQAAVDERLQPTA